MPQPPPYVAVLVRGDDYDDSQLNSAVRLQVAPEGKYSGAIFGSTSVLKEVWAEGGLKALYRGTLPIFVRAVPANAACFCGFEVCMDALTKAGMP